MATPGLKQGRWNSEEVDKTINWKELHTYYRALDKFEHLLRGKLVIAKLDNACSVHYINNGTGRIPELADLTRAVRLREASMGVEAVAIHLPGERTSLQTLSLDYKPLSTTGTLILTRRFGEILYETSKTELDASRLTVWPRRMVATPSRPSTSTPRRASSNKLLATDLRGSFLPKIF